MTPRKNPDEDVAATDAVFEELAERTDEQPVTAGPDPATPLPPPGSSESESAPVGDYVRELQEEFEEHQDDALP